MKKKSLLYSIMLIMSVSCTNAQRPTKYVAKKTFPTNMSPVKHHLGINAFEWDFSDHNNDVISAGRVQVMRSFGGFRHYLEWNRLESNEGKYTFNPVHSGGWNFDNIYKICKENGIEVIADIKGCPDWLVKTYPEKMRDAENVPAPYGLSRTDPASYVKQAKVAFQFAARYGRNKNVPEQLLSVDKKTRWTDDPPNYIRKGLDYVRYMECDNERDKTWKGPQALQNPEEYAANMSAFYDGHMGKLGKNAGVKTADPTMKVVMGGLSDPKPAYVIRMIEWCRKHRGLKKDGSVNLCFDIINYHSYSNDYVNSGEPTVGKPPELSQSARIADEFVTMSKKHAKGMEVWITEAGYDINPKSHQRAPAIGAKPALITQADWMLRSTFLYIRHGLKRSFYYMLDDLDLNSGGPYASAGFATGHKRKPVADYFYQTKQLMGDFHFIENLSADPVVDVYGLNDRKIFVMFVPDEKNRKTPFKLNLNGATSAKIYTLEPGADQMSTKEVKVSGGTLDITLTETPVFVEPVKS